MTTRTALASLEFYRVTITTDPTSDPTTLPVKLAFATSGSAPVTWVNANWELGGPPYVAAVLVGPTGEGSDVELAAGTYDVYAEITDVNETPRFQVDRLVVYTDTATFASVTELADVLRTDIDPEDAQANQALRDATNSIRAYTGQVLSLVEGDEVALDGLNRYGILLPEVPAISINSVTTLDNVGTETLLDVVSYRVDRAGILWRMDGCPWWWGHANVVVDYDHGYATIPDDLHTACIEIGAHNYAGAVAAAGNVESETIGSYSVRYGTASNTTVSGAQAIPANWKVILDHYRVPK